MGGVRRRTTRAVLTVGIIVMALAITTSTYAKLVVLSYGFDNDTQGFTAAIQQNPDATCSASTSASWGSDGTLQITVSAADTCAGAALIIDKLVVLNSTVQRPSTDMVIRDDSGLLSLRGAAAS